MIQSETRASRLLRRAPIIVIALGALVALVFFRHMLSLRQLEHNSNALLALRDAHYIPTVLAFMAIYTVVVVISIPGAFVMTLAGGYLFGLFPGVFYNVVSATTGAILVFSAARTGFGHEIAARIEARGGSVARLHQALKEHQVSVLLTMRLIPVLPFFITNLAPAMVGVRWWTFAITTFVGIIPADLIYTQLGAGLGEAFADGGHPNLHILLTPKFALPLVGLALLSAAPLLLKLRNRRRG